MKLISCLATIGTSYGFRAYFPSFICVSILAQAVYIAPFLLSSGDPPIRAMALPRQVFVMSSRRVHAIPSLLMVGHLLA